MLLAQKAYVEGALSLCLYAARLVDDQATHPDEAARADAELLLDLLTPVVKAWPSEFCLEANKLAMQVLGGYGYTRDYPVEQLYRDNRLNAIHEGTNGIQAIDLLGRKVRFRNGAALSVFERAVRADIDAARGEDGPRRVRQRPCRRSWMRSSMRRDRLSSTPNRDIRLYLANASVYCDLFGHLVDGLDVAAPGVGCIRRASLRADISRERRQLLSRQVGSMPVFLHLEMGRIDHWLNIFARMDRSTLETDPDWLDMLANLDASAVQHHGVALGNERPERRALPRPPHLRGYVLAGKHRRGEPCLDMAHAIGIVTA